MKHETKTYQKEDERDNLRLDKLFNETITEISV